MLEKKIQREIIEYLNRNGWFVVKNILLSCSGFPDISAYKSGVSIFIEVKSPNGVLSELQKIQITKLSDNGFLVVVAKSIDDVRSAMEKHPLN